MKLAEILKRQAEINTRMAAIKALAENPETSAEDIAKLDEETNNLIAERNELNRQAVALRATAEPFAPVVGGADNGTPEQRANDVLGSLEYRKAFMNYMMRGEMSNILKRNDASTTTDGVTSVIIPATITSQLYERNPYAGSLFARVTKTNYPAGMNIPTINFTPTLSWVAENSKSDRLKATTGYISFSGYKGQIRLAISLETEVKTLEQFEARLLEALVDAVSEGLDTAITVGTGVGQPTGILTGDSTFYGAHAVKLNNKQVEDYSEWIKVYSKLPRKVQSKAQLHINKVDWQAHILGMKDSNGKVIALETMGFGGNLVPMFMGKEVVILEDQGVADFDSITGSATASKTTAFAYFFDDRKYVLNSNLQLVLRKYIDEDTDETIHKATLIADGKVVNAESLLIVCRDVDATEEESAQAEGANGQS